MSHYWISELIAMDADELRRAEKRVKTLEAENAALREALEKISNRSSVMAWSEDGEVREAMREMEEIAEAALARQTEEKE